MRGQCKGFHSSIIYHLHLFNTRPRIKALQFKEWLIILVAYFETVGLVFFNELLGLINNKLSVIYSIILNRNFTPSRGLPTYTIKAVNQTSNSTITFTEKFTPRRKLFLKVPLLRQGESGAINYEKEAPGHRFFFKSKKPLFQGQEPTQISRKYLF